VAVVIAVLPASVAVEAIVVALVPTVLEADVDS